MVLQSFVEGYLIIVLFTSLGITSLMAAELWKGHEPCRQNQTAQVHWILRHPRWGVGFETLDRKMFEPERTYDALSKARGEMGAGFRPVGCRCETVKGKYDFAWLDEVVDSLIRIGVAAPGLTWGMENKLYTPEAPKSTAVGWIPENSV